MPLKIGINADSFTMDGDLSVLDEMLSRFEGVGFSHAEIPIHGLDCLIDGQLSAVRLSDSKKILNKHTLLYTVHAPDGVNLADADQPEIHAAALRSTIDFASEIGAETVVYHGSFVYPGSPEAADGAAGKWPAEIERLGRAAVYARAKGVCVAVENIFRQSPAEITYRTDPRQLAAVVGAVGEPSLGICFDFGHAWIGAAESGFAVDQALEAALPRLLHVHIHDNFGKPAKASMKAIDTMFQGVGDLHLPPGWGRIQYSSLFPIFVPTYRGVYMLELRPRFADRYGEALSWVKKMAEEA